MLPLLPEAMNINTTSDLLDVLVLSSFAANTISWLLNRQTRYVYVTERGFLKIAFLVLVGCVAVTAVMRLSRFYTGGFADVPRTVLIVGFLLYAMFCRERERKTA